MANIENKENTNNPINKTTETLIKELETMSDSGLHDLFLFFYKLNCQHGNIIYNDKFNEFLEAFNIPRQIVKREIAEGEKSIIDIALVKYANYSPWALVEKSHNQDPWKYNYGIFGDRALIPYQSIKDYFSGGDAR